LDVVSTRLKDIFTPTWAGPSRLWKPEIRFDGIFEGLGLQPQAEHAHHVRLRHVLLRRRGGDFCPPKTDLESGLLLSRSASDEICRKLSLNFSPAGVTSPFVARAMPMAAARTSCRSAGERAGVCQPHLGPVYLRVSAACLPNFFKSRSNVSRSLFERTLATSSIAAACSPNPRLISARPLGVSSTLRTRRSSG